MTNTRTKEGIQVAVGQRWRDLDKRMNRICTVVAVDEQAGKVTMKGAALSKVRIDRMHLLDSYCFLLY